LACFRFSDCAKKLESTNGASAAVISKAPELSEQEVIRLVRDYVERMDERFRKNPSADPPHSELEKKEGLINAAIEAQVLRDRDDPRAEQMLYLTGKDILKAAGHPVEPNTLGAQFTELVRHALIELSRRDASRLQDDHGRGFFDNLFDNELHCKMFCQRN
jgi:hypothetical protein